MSEVIHKHSSDNSMLLSLARTADEDLARREAEKEARKSGRKKNRKAPDDAERRKAPPLPDEKRKTQEMEKAAFAAKLPDDPGGHIVPESDYPVPENPAADKEPSHRAAQSHDLPDDLGGHAAPEDESPMAENPASEAEPLHHTPSGPDIQDDPFSGFASALEEGRSALSRDAASPEKGPAKHRLKKGTEVGEEVTKEHAEKVLSNKELGGRRATIIVRTKVVDEKGHTLSSSAETLPDGREERHEEAAPPHAPKKEKAPEPKEKPEAPSMLLIRIDTGEAYELAGRLSVGRTEDNDICIPNPDGYYVSTHHAFIEVQGRDIYVKDNDSTNGTYLNDRKIASKRIREGDTIEFANIKFRLERAED